MAHYVRQIVEDVRYGRISTVEGKTILTQEYNSLVLRGIEAGKKLLLIGAGITQVTMGGGVCAITTPLGCTVLGMPIVAHGANNIYENSTNLWTGRNDAQGALRKIYHHAAIAAGGTAAHGNAAYGTMDIAISGFGIFRKVRKPETWKIFNYIKSDYARAYTQTGKLALAFEALVSSITLYQIKKDLEEK
ncbi:DUF4225 domain-containing protein [Pseudomonas putida]|uniref:DUF4225 domain-containing protein n=1 Tax=Pseudomonas putida TaxID=303 RepID=UPI0009BCDFB1|nr:DUF4225 domain-containing protein [Pseudomonas putida]